MCIRDRTQSTWGRANIKHPVFKKKETTTTNLVKRKRYSSKNAYTKQYQLMKNNSVLSVVLLALILLSSAFAVQIDSSDQATLQTSDQGIIQPLYSKCPQGCYSCTSDNRYCTSCIDGSYFIPDPNAASSKNPTGTCNPCPEQCLSCFPRFNRPTEVRCSLCKKGFYVRDGLCVPAQGQPDAILIRKELTESKLTASSAISSQEWSISYGQFSSADCQSFNVLGLFKDQILYKNLKSLRTHYQVYGTFKVYMVNGYCAQLVLENNDASSIVWRKDYCYYPRTQSVCGSNRGFVDEVQVAIPHKLDWLQLKFYALASDTASSSGYGGWGIRDVSISIYPCAKNCDGVCYGPKSADCNVCPAASLPILAYDRNRKGFQCINPPKYNRGEKILAFDFVGDDYGKTLAPQQVKEWSITPAISSPLSQCGKDLIFGGYQKFNSHTVTKTLKNLSPHYLLRISFFFFRIDKWGPADYVRAYLDDRVIHHGFAAMTQNTYSLCGNSNYQDYVERFDLMVQHIDSTATLKFVGYFDAKSPTGYWGIRDVVISLFRCSDNCPGTTCKGPTYDDCDGKDSAHTLFYTNFVVNLDQEKNEYSVFNITESQDLLVLSGELDGVEVEANNQTSDANTEPLPASSSPLDIARPAAIETIEKADTTSGDSQLLADGSTTTETYTENVSDETPTTNEECSANESLAVNDQGALQPPTDAVTNVSEEESPYNSVELLDEVEYLAPDMFNFLQVDEKIEEKNIDDGDGLPFLEDEIIEEEEEDEKKEEKQSAHAVLLETSQHSFLTRMREHTFFMFYQATYPIQRMHVLSWIYALYGEQNLSLIHI
eukprot:TRINITY_DN7440_c0_g1_i1.p1 TRINITY_DN7440_c0_g1~~TRINITY_DN7440_c0_g1_i1.p1  ORF type:complete len:853 (+),score=175.69 TRINITY_DN7440_c0_g1_i1:76-2559(+)